MMRWQAISFYTIGTGYEQEIKKLIASCERLGIPIKAYGVPPVGNWRANLDWKSTIIRQAMDDFPDKDIVFMDADAVVRSWPALFDELSEKREHDLAVLFYKNSRIEPNELVSGTIWIANTAKSRKIVEDWDSYARKHHEIRHQKAFDETLRMMRPPASIFCLPDAYTRIFDAPGMRGVVPVIEHFQASRRFRSKVRAIIASSGGPFSPALGRRFK